MTVNLNKNKNKHIQVFSKKYKILTTVIIFSTVCINWEQQKCDLSSLSSMTTWGESMFQEPTGIQGYIIGTFSIVFILET
jgi:hypothetical protein